MRLGVLRHKRRETMDDRRLTMDDKECYFPIVPRPSSLVHRPSSLVHRSKSGTSIIFAVFALVVLSIFSMALFSLISTDSGSAASQVLSEMALCAAEAGWQIGAQAVRDDKDASFQTSNPNANGYCGTVYFDGYQAFVSNGSDETKACFYKKNPMDDRDSEDYASLSDGTFADGTCYLIIWDFEQRTNMIGTRIKDARLIMSARRGGGGGENPTIQLQYTTNGSDLSPTWTNVGSSITVSSSSWIDTYCDFTANPTWSEIMDSDDFRIRALRTNSGNTRETRIDYLGMELTVEVDAMTEPWASGSYITLPAALGNANIKTITITDESSKVHLNYASEALLRELMEELSISDAANKATAIINYRSGDWFNTIEEVNQISNPTALDSGDFDLLKDYITVYSWVNQNVTMASGSRAPINVNTASETVLRAIFKTISLALWSDTRADNLAAAIVADRVSEPFTHMNSSFDFFSDNVNTFSYYLRTKRDDINIFDDDSVPNRKARMRAVAEVADGSYYNFDLTSSWTTPATDQTATEFCYYSHAFLITSTGKNGNIERTVLETYGDTYNYTTYTYDSEGELALTAHIGEASPKPYWREEH